MAYDPFAALKSLPGGNPFQRTIDAKKEREANPEKYGKVQYLQGGGMLYTPPDKLQPDIFRDVGTKGSFKYMGYFPNPTSGMGAGSKRGNDYGYLYTDAFGRTFGFNAYGPNMEGFRETVTPINAEFNSIAIEEYDREFGWYPRYEYFAYTPTYLKTLQDDAARKIPQPVVQPLFNRSSRVAWSKVDTTSNRVELGLPSRRSGLRIPQV